MSRAPASSVRSDELSSTLRRHLPALLLIALLVSAVGLLWTVESPGRVPEAWPAVGLLTGVLLLADASRRTPWFALGTTMLVLSHLVTGAALVAALGLGLGTAGAAWVTHHRLRRGLGEARVGLLDDGDVSRLVAASAQGATVAAALAATVSVLTGAGAPGLIAVAVWGTHAAGLLLLVPLFVDAPDHAALASSRERVAQSVIIVVVTVAVFGYGAAPPLVFAVMPMFAWLAYRGTLREASRLLVLVAVIATTATILGVGPVSELAARYDLPAELVTGFLQLFLIDCALILLPLSVMTTQQRIAAARESAGRATLQRLVESATGSAVLATDLEGRVSVFNPGAEQVFSRGAAELVGAPADRLFSHRELVRQADRLGTRPRFADLCAAASTATDRADRALWAFVRPDGEERQVLLTITAVLDEHQQATGYLCVGEDVTEREAAHRSLLLALDRERAAVERLSHLEQVKSDFVAAVSHELRTPLTSMLGYVELLEGGEVGDLSNAQQAMVCRVQRNGRRLLLLVEDLLLLSQIEARQLHLEPVPTDLRDTVVAAYDALRSVLAGRDLDVALQLPSEPVRHDADPDQVERLVLNLLGNAVKFTPDGGRVEVLVSERPDQVELVLVDTGMGIAAAEQDQLFTRFFRSSRATAQAIPGTGLGLTIARAIAERHGGSVDISSQEDVGTTVTVTLPKRLCPTAGGVVDAPEVTTAPASGPAPASPASTSHRGARR